MSRYDIDADFEAQVRAELRQTIVPPPVPEHVREGVENMAEKYGDAATQSPRNRAWLTRPLILVRVAALAVVLVLVAVTVMLMGTRPAGGPAAGLPLPPAPADPLATPGPTFSTAYDFPGASTATLLDVTSDGAAFVYVEGQGLRVSTDSGVTWSEARTVPYSSPGPNQPPRGVDFVDSLHGWQLQVVETETQVQLVEFRTADSGRTWLSTPVTSFAKSSGWYAFAWTHFVSPVRGVIHVGLYQPRLDQAAGMDGCSLLTTTDGGRTWSSPSTEPCPGEPQEPTWSTDVLGFALNMPDQLAVTEDGGATWKAGTVPAAADEMGAQGLLLSNDGAGHLSFVEQITPKNGADWPPREAVFESADGGATWQASYSGRFPGQVGIGGIVALAPDLWMTSMSAPDGSGDQLIESQDAGRTWLALPGPRFDQVVSMRWWDSRRGVVQGWNTSCTPESQQPAARSGEPAPTSVPSASGAACAASSVYVTNDGGETWHHVPF
jgi:photosystem II stability/assembly factor-like uncharacterized protein